MIGWFDAHLVSMVDGVAYGLLLFTLAVGLSLVFGMMDVLNLAHGTLYLAGAYTAYALSDGSWLGLLVALVVGLAVGLLGGGLLAAAVAPLQGRGHLDQAALTLGIMLIAGELMIMAFGAEVLPTAPPQALADSIPLLGNSYPLYRLVFIGVAGLLAALVYLAFERSSIGALVRATVADRDMVRAMGVDTRKILFGVFGFGAALAAVGGVLGAPIIAPGPGIDERVLVLSLVVIVIGGLGSVRGALLGALLIGQVQTLGVALVPAYAPFLLFGAMLLVLALRPQGLFAVGRA
ncbi:branched-chain amino acid ABC transporter permease [Ornithinimicrobium cerasi]|uniref:Amino acid/amide ABC transporter membrane protein 1, HAAT family n=1 Tax=Ornithinimicrobium cerasi TaxID=2248773 RepID=A0A285VIG4_9MICO|nr:branched-chain amino acid ABC transporter permease [Ornithinimicrobium cerasi]SOC53667.1 amino acid/amide ABC transporter membrane protein 1, HAAT family [Ornithinimicrobium cerasi]